MNINEAIKIRRSVRKYEDKPVEKEKIEELLRAAMQAPSAGNQQPWEFIVVENKETLQQLAKASPYAAPVKNAPLGIVVLAKDEFLKFPSCWQQDLSAATENMLLKAVELGLGAVWLGIAPEKERMEFIKALFRLPQGVRPFALLAIGYSSENHFVDRFDASRIHYEKY